MLRSLSIVAAIAILITAGIFAGLRTGRFGPREDLKAAAARLQEIPKQTGSWVMKAEFELDRKIQERAEAVGYLDRAYQNEKTGERVRVLMLCGDPGPIGAHTPEVCYGGLDFIAGSKRHCSLALPGESNEYFSTVFRKENGGEQPLRVCWAWGVDGDWYASDSPRAEFVARSVLYKFYVTRVARAGESEAAGDDVIRDFLLEFLPEVKKVLAPQ